MEESIRSTGGSLANYLRALLGTYTPTDTTSMAGADWEYIFNFILVILLFYCIMRIFGSLFK